MKKLNLKDVRAIISEEIVDISSFRRRKDVATYEKLISKFIGTWDLGLGDLQYAKEFLTEDERSMLDELTKDYETAALNLSRFLRGKRSAMKK